MATKLHDIPSPFPVYFAMNVEDLGNIEENVALVIFNDGIFRYTKAENFDELDRVDELFSPVMQGVGKSDGLTDFRYKPFTEEFLETTIKFFRWAMMEFGEVEAFLYLLYNEKTGQWLGKCVEQTVAKESVDYDRKKPKCPKGFKCVGTIHSHNTMRAFQSSTDIEDQKNNHGIHVTVGKLHHIVPSFDVCISAMGGHYRVDPNIMLPEAYQKDTTEYDVSDEWKALVTKRPKAKVKTGSGKIIRYAGASSIALPDVSSEVPNITDDVLGKFYDGVKQHPMQLREALGVNCTVKLFGDEVEVHLGTRYTRTDKSWVISNSKENFLNWVNTQLDLLWSTQLHENGKANLTARVQHSTLQDYTAEELAEAFDAAGGAIDGQ